MNAAQTRRTPAGGIARWRQRVMRVGLALAAVFLVIVIGLSAAVVSYGAADGAAPSDVIVVLGGGASTYRRAEHAAQLYKAGYAPVVLCSGGFVPGDPVSEADHCARAARRHGVPPAAILREETSRSTEENAIESAALLQARGWSTALVVSDDYHLLRARWMFERQGLTVRTSPAQATSGALPLVERVPAVLREVLALIWFAFKTVLGLPYTNVRGV